MRGTDPNAHGEIANPNVIQVGQVLTVPAKPGAWITNGDWDHEWWGGALPTREWIDAITPTESSTSLREALQVAAGLANPSKQPESSH